MNGLRSFVIVLFQVNVEEVVKSATLRRQEAHLHAATEERAYYNNMVETSKKIVVDNKLSLGHHNENCKNIGHFII